MAQPNSKATLKEYVKRKLGAPVLEINVDDDQFDDRLDEGLQYFREYCYDGSIKCYLKHQLTQSQLDSFKTDESHSAATAGGHAVSNQTYKEQQNYLTLPEHVLSVLNILPFNDKHNLNMFDVRYQLRLNDLYDFSSTSIVHYQMTMQHLDFLDHILVGEKPMRFNQLSNRLYVDMDWGTDITAGEYLIFEVYRKVDPDTYTDLYDDLYLKRYVTALIKRQWGQNLSKFSGTAMLGGVTLNGPELFSTAIEEQSRLEEEIRLNYEEPPHMQQG